MLLELISPFKFMGRVGISPFKFMERVVPHLVRDCFGPPSPSLCAVEAGLEAGISEPDPP